MYSVHAPRMHIDYPNFFPKGSITNDLSRPNLSYMYIYALKLTLALTFNEQHDGCLAGSRNGVPLSGAPEFILSFSAVLI